MNLPSKDDASQYYSSSAPNMPLNLQQQQQNSYSGNDITPFNQVVYHASMPLLRNAIDQRLSILHSNPVATVSTALYPVMISSQSNDNIAFQTIGVVPSTANDVQTNPYYIQPNYQVTLHSSRESVNRRTASGVGTETHRESLNAGRVQVPFPNPQVSNVTLGDKTARLSIVHSETYHNIKATNNELKTLSTQHKRFPFPRVLYQMLMKAESMNFSDIISFLPHGRAFIVRDKSRFERMVMPKFFSHQSFKSFRRQVNLYDFKRLRNEECSTAYYHEAFLRGRPDLLDSIKLKKSKGVERKDSNEIGLDGDPDFYRMDVISPVPS